MQKILGNRKMWVGVGDNVLLLKMEQESFFWIESSVLSPVSDVESSTLL